MKKVTPCATTPRDHDQRLHLLRQLESQIFAEQSYSEAQILQITHDSLSDDSSIDLFFRDNIAYLIAQRVEGGHFAELWRIGVVSEMRGCGHAAALLSEWIESMATNSLIEQLYLEVAESNQAARRLYERAGFGLVNRRRNYYADGEAALVMALELRSLQPSRTQDVGR